MSNSSNIIEQLFSGDQFITTKQAAMYTGFSVSWFEWRRCNGGGIPFIRVKRSIRYNLKTVTEWMNNQPIHHNTSKLGGDNV